MSLMGCGDVLLLAMLETGLAQLFCALCCSLNADDGCF